MAELATVLRDAGGLDARDVTILTSSGLRRHADC